MDMLGLTQAQLILVQARLQTRLNKDRCNMIIVDNKLGLSWAKLRLSWAKLRLAMPTT